MKMVNIHDAKTHFSKLINRALNGEEIVIARGGKAIIKLTPYFENLPVREGGQFSGLITIAEDFDAPLPSELLKQFYEDENMGENKNENEDKA